MKGLLVQPRGRPAVPDLQLQRWEGVRRGRGHDRDVHAEIVPVLAEALH